MVHKSDGSTEFFDVVTQFVLRDTLSPYFFIFCVDYVLQTSIHLTKGNSFTLKRQDIDDISEILILADKAINKHFT